MNVNGLLKLATERLLIAEIATARLDAELMLANVMNKDRRWLWCYGENEISSSQAQAYFLMLTRREAREPLAYILGEWEFYGRAFIVTPAVLIPRPETELLVEALLPRLVEFSPARIVDVGVGSGAIAVTIALEYAAANLLAVDISPQALSVAKMNAQRYGVLSAIDWYQGDLLQPLIVQNINVAVIVGNLPYICDVDMDSLMPEVAQYEPKQALCGGTDGLREIRRLVEQSPSCLSANGILALEMGSGQAEALQEILTAAHWRDIVVINDYAAIPRHILARRPITI